LNDQIDRLQGARGLLGDHETKIRYVFPVVRDRILAQIPDGQARSDGGDDTEDDADEEEGGASIERDLQGRLQRSSGGSQLSPTRDGAGRSLCGRPRSLSIGDLSTLMVNTCDCVRRKVSVSSLALHRKDTNRQDGFNWNTIGLRTLEGVLFLDLMVAFCSYSERERQA